MSNNVKSMISLVLWIWCFYTAAALVAALAIGCTGLVPQKGGQAIAGQYTIHQPDNPKTSASQSISESNKAVIRLPLGGVATNLPVVSTIEVPAWTVVEVVSTKHVEQDTGNAFKDMAREVAAKLEAVQPVVYVGIALILLSLAMVHPIVFGALGGSRSFQMMCGVVGAVMVAAPYLWTGNERMILIAGLAVVVGYWWIRRYGEKDGIIKAKNGQA